MIVPAIVLGMGAGAALAVAIWAVIPTSPRLSDALARLAPANLDLARAHVGDVDLGSRTERVGAWVERRVTLGSRGGAFTERARRTPTFADRTKGLPGVSTPSNDLAILEISPAVFYGKKTAAAAVGFAVPAVVGAADHVFLHVLPVQIPAFVALIGAVLFWISPDLSVRAQARQARQEFAQAAVLYFELVAINRRSEKGSTTSLEAAAAISDAWMFARIREELTRSVWAGTLAWNSLDRLGERTQIPELQEIAGIMRLAGDSGAAVYSTLVAGAEGMRNRLLSAEYDRAAAATSQLSFPIAGLALLMLIGMAIPTVLNLLA